MIRWLLQSMLCLILCPLLVAQQVAAPAQTADAPQSTKPVPATASPSRTVRIENGALVALRPEQSISSADARAGDKVRFTLVNDLVADGVLIVPAGTSFYSTITSAHPKDADHYGRLSFSFTEPDLGHGKRLRLIDELSKEQKDIRDDERGWLIIEIVAVTILLPLIPFVLASDAAHPHPHQAKYKPMPRDLYYPKGKVVKFYVQHTLKIRTDQLAASNAPAPVQGGIDTHPKPQNQDTSTPRSAGSETTTVFVIPIK
jgi:hypothetical protein